MKAAGIALNVAIHKSIHSLDQAEWDSLVSPGEIWHRHAVLALLEDGGVSNGNPRYIVFRDPQGRLAAHAAAYLCADDLLIFAKGAVRHTAEAVRRFAPAFLKPRILECGWLLSPGKPICHGPGLEISQIAPLLGRALDRIAQEERARFIVLRDFEDEALPSFAALRAQGFRAVPNLPTTKLAIRWVSFDHYLAAMRKRYRSRINTALKQAAAGGLAVRLRQDFGEQSAMLAAQWNTLNDRAKELRLNPLTADFYGGARSAFGPGCSLIEILSGDDVVAHALIAEDGRLLRWLFFGRSGSQTRDGAYFLALATIIRIAIESGKEEVEMGLTTYAAKTLFGGVMTPLSMLVKARGLLPSGPAAALFRLLNTVPAPQQRRIFRERAD